MGKLRTLRGFVSLAFQGVDVKYRNCNYSKFLCASHIPELLQLELVENGVFIGSSVTMTCLQVFLQEQIRKLPGEKRRVIDILNW